MDNIPGTGAYEGAEFQTNGNKPVPSAPFYEPCRDDQGKLFDQTGGKFWGNKKDAWVDAAPEYGALNPRIYKGANIQIDAVLNKAGYHFPQQRIIALWDDVMPTINKQRAPEPLVMRSNTYDCVKYLHTNLVPEYYELDDYQVRTPTDIIGQHIHLPKWDLVSNDGSGNGWNYEDGTLSPGTVRERIHAINEYNLLHALDPVKTLDNRVLLEATVDPGEPLFAQDPDWLGARVTIQRWFTDPVFNTEHVDRGLGIVFTHDHYGPSTHQQVGLYATILAEPARSTWKHNETGDEFGTRHDGGPTSWQAQIVREDGSAFREFYFEFGDFQHAYEKGVYVGADERGKSLNVNHEPVPVDANGNLIGEFAGVTQTTFQSAINPSYRQEPKDKTKVFPDIVRFPPTCPSTDKDGNPLLDAQGNPVVIKRPCSEAISADDVGMLVTNYRNEPIGLRVYDPNRPGPDGKNGTQAAGDAGDLAFALQTRTDRAINAFNTARGHGTAPDGEVVDNTPQFLEPLNRGILAGDPYTPMIRAYPGDEIKIKIQAGSTEHEHNATVHGIKWLQGGSGHGQAPNSGWRNTQNDGISEQFTFHAPEFHDPGRVKGIPADYAYATDSSQDGWWTGMWGIMRIYDPADGLPLAGEDLLMPLPDDVSVVSPAIANRRDFNGVCPVDAPLREYTVVAVTAQDVLDNPLALTLDDQTDGTLPLKGGFESNFHVGARVNQDGGTLVYNNRPGGQTAAGGTSAALHDPTGLLYVLLEDLEVRPLPDGSIPSGCSADSKGGGKKGGGGGANPVLKPGCDVRIRSAALPVKPLALRAAAGECVDVTLYNRLPEDLPDLAGYNTLLQIVNRRIGDAQAGDQDPGSLFTFNNNLIRPSSQVGLHPQLVEYDVTKHDGANVGVNPVQTVPTKTWDE
ncbi:MAG: hypothetical protein OER43_19380, partial [Gammaproteobacteria bacterium]|nr:hypothetical protein [Gammaproteobacteria bacterium]